MKTLSQLLTELTEALGIYTNPNAFEPRGSHVETPRERELRLKFERSPRGQAMIAAAQRRDTEALKRLERLKKLGLTKPTRTPFPWSKDRAGWWHATNQWFTFSHNWEGYHTTQIITKTQRFGITDSEITQALDEYIRDAGEYSEDYLKSRLDLGDNEKIESKHIKELIEGEVIDLCFPLQRRVYDKGWFKVYGRASDNGLITLEGTNKLAAKSAVREILSTTSGELRIQIDLYTPNTPNRRSSYTQLNNRAAAENYIIT